jgi:hypothetical protein
MALTPDDFRRLALGFEGASESAHMGHPDFRVGGRIFATMGHPDAAFAMVKLTPEQQQAFVEAEPGVFFPVKGGWGRGGATQVRLAAGSVTKVGPALQVAWQNLATAKRAPARPRPVRPPSPPGPRRSRGGGSGARRRPRS